MSDFNSIKTQIQSLIDSANATTGNSDTDLTTAQASLIEGYGQGGGLEGGYDVTFYDENGEILSFVSVKQGHSVEKPKYTAKKWVDGDGNIVTFPYTPTEDVSIYANNDTYASQLYKFYGVDSVVYPYIYMESSWVSSYNGYRISIYFCKRINGNIIYEYLKAVSSTGTPISDLSDLSEVIAALEEQIPNTTGFTSSTGSYNTTSNAGSSHNKYTNYDYTYNYGFYRLDLDEEEVTLPFDGLENGYDVMFYDENNEGLAFYSIKQGHSINPPIYECKGWQKADGTVVSFPYTPTADVIFYALVSTYADQLYEFYGVDKAVFPYLFIAIYQDGNYVYTDISFNKEMVDKKNFKGNMNKTAGIRSQLDNLGLTSIDKILEYVMTNYPASTLSGVYGTDTLTRWSILMTNYEFPEPSTSKYYYLNE